MLKLSKRLFAAGTLAALLIGGTQSGFAYQKASKSAKATAMSCCEKKDGVMSCPKDAAASKKAKATSTKTVSTKAGKATAKTVSNAKMSPKGKTAGGKAAAVKTSAKAAAAQPGSCCQQPDPNTQPA